MKLMLKIRLYKRGRKNDPSFDITVAEAKKKKIIEKIGFYKPKLKTDKREDKFVINNDRVIYWMSKGAYPTDIIKKILILKNISL